MKLNIYPVKIEVYDESSDPPDLVAVVESFDDETATIQINVPIGIGEWKQISEKITQAIEAMNLRQ